MQIFCHKISNFVRVFKHEQPKVTGSYLFVYLPVSIHAGMPCYKSLLVVHTDPTLDFFNFFIDESIQQ